MNLDTMTTQDLIALRDQVIAEIARRVLGDQSKGVSLGRLPGPMSITC